MLWVDVEIVGEETRLQLAFHVKFDFVVEATLHIFETIVAGKVGVVEFCDFSGALIAKG